MINGKKRDNIIPQNKQEFLNMYYYQDIDTNLYSERPLLFKYIKDGDIDFKVCLEIMRMKNFDIPEINANVLCHPKCTKQLFKSKFKYLSVVSGIYRMVLEESYLMKDFNNIVESLYLKISTIDELVRFWDKLESDSPTKKQLNYIFKNPHCPNGLKMQVYEISKNTDFLPKEAKDIFIF